MSARKAKRQRAKTRRRHRSWLAQSLAVEADGTDEVLARAGLIHWANLCILRHNVGLVGTEMGDRAAYVLGLVSLSEKAMAERAERWNKTVAEVEERAGDWDLPPGMAVAEARP